MKFRKYLFLSSLFIIAFFISSCNSNDEWVDWTEDMYKIGDTVGSYETSDMQIIIRDATIKRVDGVNKLVLSIRMANNTPYYIQLYDGNFNVYDYTLGKNSYPLQVYGMNAGYSYFPLGDQYSRLPEIGKNGLNQVDFYIAYNITDSTDINNLYIAVNLGDIDLGHIQFYSIYLGGGISNNEDSDVVVSFITNSEASLTSEIVQFERKYGILPIPEKKGHTFLGWFLNNNLSGEIINQDSIVSNQGNHSLYAKWKANNYQVTLVYNDELTADSIFEVTYGDSYGFDQPTRDGYELIGWFFNKDFSGSMLEPNDLVDITSNAILYANWKPLISITLDYNNPNLENELVKIPLFSFYEINIPNSNFGIFDGWFFDLEFKYPITSTTYVENTESHTIYAKWFLQEDPYFYGYSGNDYAYSSIINREGNIVVVGKTYENPNFNIWFMIINSNYEILIESSLEIDGWGSANSIIQDTNGDYIIVGQAYSKALIIKLDSEGNIIFYKFFNGDVFNDVIEDSDGNYVMIGTITRNPTGINEINGYYIKTDKLGNIEFENIYGNSFGEIKFKSVIQDINGDYVFVGSAFKCVPSGQNQSLCNQGYSILMYRTNSEGQYKDVYLYNYSPSTNAYDVIQDSDGNYVIAGYIVNSTSGLSSTSNTDAVLLKVDQRGVVVSLIRYYLDPRDELNFYSVTQDQEENYIAVGYYRKSNTFGKIPLIVIFDSEGNVINVFNYNSEINGEFQKVVILPDFYYAVIGSGNNKESDALIVIFK
jgi:uncharacterized repeat protein (TIGR02543 family)